MLQARCLQPQIRDSVRLGLQTAPDTPRTRILHRSVTELLSYDENRQVVVREALLVQQHLNHR